MNRMYRYSYIGVMLVASMLMLGCADQEEPQRVEELVGVDLAFSVPAPADITGTEVITRMADDVVQLTSSNSRNLEDVIFIPFKTKNTISIDDVPAQYLSYAGWTIYPKSYSQFYYNRRCQFVQGVASVLVYGHGAYSIGNIPGEDKSYYGSTTANIPADLTPAGISFVPTQIRDNTEYDEKGQALAAYLTSIANTEGWSTTTDSKLKALYYNFIGKREGMVDHRVFASSSTSILGYVNELYKESGLYVSDNTLGAAIRTNIAKKATVTDGVVTALASDLTGYPANIGLPDGAAAIQWISGTNGISGEFAPQTTTTTIAPITSVTRFAYPAELYYYSNSLISTSNREITPSKYESETLWSKVLQYYTGSGVVDASTRAVAINTPMQYGVARLSTNLNAAPYTLIDGEGAKYLYGTDWNDRSFPLTAVIVGGQYPVGFDFKPETVKANPDDAKADMRYVYDPQVKTNKSGVQADYYYLSTKSQNNCTNTLVLQSYENEKVTVILEFENRSGKKFKGKDSMVYPGAKFYLIGYVDPTVLPGSDDYYNRVFTQDYVTTFNMTVDQKCLANAYSVMPDLSASRMEIGVLVVPKWDVITPTNVELF